MVRFMNEKTCREEPDRQRDELLRRALATPPISNEDILKRSRESREKSGQRK